DDTGKQMLLYRILQTHKEELSIFRKAAEQRGFIEELNELFTEFRRYSNRAQDVEQMFTRASLRSSDVEDEQSAILLQKLQDLQFIYQQYEQQLADRYVDSEDYLQTLAEQARSSTYLQEAELWIDGFAGFTPQEYAVIGELMRTVKHLTMTICLDR